MLCITYVTYLCPGMNVSQRHVTLSALTRGGPEKVSLIIAAINLASFRTGLVPNHFNNFLAHIQYTL